MNPRCVPFGASPSFALSFKISSMLSLISIYLGEVKNYEPRKRLSVYN
jgi:hypothetical protein